MKEIKWRKKYTPRKLKRKKGQPKEKKNPQIYSIKFKNCLFFFLMITKMNKSKTTPQKSQMFLKFSLVKLNIIWFPKLFYLVVEKFEAEGRDFS